MIEERSYDKINDKSDKTITTIKEEQELPYSELEKSDIIFEFLSVISLISFYHSIVNFDVGENLSLIFALAND